jgi:hypothetical protein
MVPVSSFSRSRIHVIRNPLSVKNTDTPSPPETNLAPKWLNTIMNAAIARIPSKPAMCEFRRPLASSGGSEVVFAVDVILRPAHGNAKLSFFCAESCMIFKS